jgi:hypothetical protein
MTAPSDESLRVRGCCAECYGDDASTPSGVAGIGWEVPAANTQSRSARGPTH